MQTRHWSVIGVAGVAVANTFASAVCGHSVDVQSLDYGAIGYSVIIGFADWINAHFGKGSGGTNPVQPSTNNNTQPPLTQVV